VRQGAAGFRLSIMADRVPAPQVDPRWMKYILAKGFIAVDGISLTVGAVLMAQWAYGRRGPLIGGRRSCAVRTVSQACCCGIT